MKVAYNTCFGGFGLSPLALVWLRRRGVSDTYEVTQDSFTTLDRIRKGLELGVVLEGLLDANGRLTGKVPDFGLIDTVMYGMEASCIGLLDPYLKRNDPLLIECLETLGKAAWGRFAEITIKEIPGDAKWHIHEYDGNEALMKGEVPTTW